MPWGSRVFVRFLRFLEWFKPVGSCRRETERESSLLTVVTYFRGKTYGYAIFERQSFPESRFFHKLQMKVLFWYRYHSFITTCLGRKIIPRGNAPRCRISCCHSSECRLGLLWRFFPRGQSWTLGRRRRTLHGAGTVAPEWPEPRRVTKGPS